MSLGVFPTGWVSFFVPKTLQGLSAKATGRHPFTTRAIHPVPGALATYASLHRAETVNRMSMGAFPTG